MQSDKEIPGILSVAWDEKGNFNIWRFLHSPQFLSSSFLERTARIIEESYHDFDVVAGVGRKGGILAACLSRILKKQCVSCNPIFALSIVERRQVKRQISELTGKNVLIVDDTTHSGEAYQKARRILVDCGFNVVGGFVLVWMDIDGPKKPLDQIKYLCAQSATKRSGLQ